MNANKPPTLRLTAKQSAFARLVASGTSQADAYRQAYQPKATDRTAAENGSKTAKRPAVVAEIARLRGQSEVKAILTLNDRLRILAKDAQTGGDTHADKNARARSIEVYSKISGDQAPERHEVTGKDGGPIPVAAAVATRTMSRREKVEAIKAQRAAVRASETTPNTGAPNTGASSQQ